MVRMTALRQIYSRLLKKHPTVVQSVQAALLIGSGDLISQTVIERNKPSQIDIMRTSKFFSVGLGIIGPATVIWYRFLERVVGRGNSPRIILMKVAMDQLMFAPLFLFIFITVFNTLDGQNWDYIKKELNHKYTDILITNYAVWPLVQGVNFSAIPLRHQVLFAQTIALFWNTYLCWKTHHKNNYK